MSAFIVSKEHIDALVDVTYCGPDDGERWETPRYFYNGDRHVEIGYDPDELGRLLWGENLKSVAARYPDDGPGDRPGPMSENIDAEIASYTFDQRFPRLSCVSALKQIACLEYQSCEHDGWESSDTKAFLERLFHSIVSVLPGYDDAPWGL